MCLWEGGADKIPALDVSGENNALGAKIFDVMIQRLASALLIKSLSLQPTSILKRPTVHLFRAPFIFLLKVEGKLEVYVCMRLIFCGRPQVRS